MMTQLIDLIFNNPNDINILYTNINGKEELFINGKEIKQELIDETVKFDDTETKEYVKDFKSLLEDLNDNLFIEFMDELSEIIDINQMNNLIDQESFTKEDAECVECLITQAKNILAYVINSQIEYLEDIKNKL